jgi:A/G-specific adenine glycosylase
LEVRVRSPADKRKAIPAAVHSASSVDFPALRRRLVAWYRRQRRDLPWRRSRDPYRIWISEIMLQQTRVDVVVPYFERFMTRFPNVETLACAPLPKVLHAWAGLGYYSRARHLHAAAQRVVHEFGGTFPASAAEIESLPGIGRYTAGAIRSIAFDEQAPILDGNVARVFARLFALEGSLETTPARSRLWELAAEWARCRTPGDANQALMELGALVCTKPAPVCAGCPLAERCAARLSGRIHQLPQPRRRPAALRLCLSAGLVHRDDQLLLVRRRSGRLLRDWWELPTCEEDAGNGARIPGPALEPGARRNAGARRLAATLRARLGVGMRRARPLGVVHHGILNVQLLVTVFGAAAGVTTRGGRESPARWRAVAATSARRSVAGGEPARIETTTGRTGIANLEHGVLETRWLDAASCRRLPLSTLTRKALRVAAVHDARWHAFVPPSTRQAALTATPTPRPSARRSSRRGT